MFGPRMMIAALSGRKRRPAVPPPSGGDTDWDARKTASGVFKFDALETTTKMVAGPIDASHWVLNNGLQANVSLDTSIKPVGALGSWAIACLSAASAGNADIGIYYGDVVTFGANQTFWTSYDFYCPDAWAFQQWCANYETGAKLSISSNHANSDTVNEVVVQSNYNAGIITGYHQDGHVTALPPDVGYSDAFTSSDFIWQPKVDNGLNPLTGNDPETGSAWTGYQQDVARWGGLYSSKSTAAFRHGIGHPLSGAVRFAPGFWVTVIEMERTGTSDGTATDGRWVLWVQINRTGPLIMIHDVQNAQMGAGPVKDTKWLLPYVSQRSPGGRKITAVGTGLNGITLLACGVSTAIGNGTLEYVASTKMFRFEAINDSFGTAHTFSSANNKMLMSLASSSDGATTTTNGSVTLPQSSIVLTSAASFPSGGGSIALGTPDTSTGGTGPSHGNGEQYVTYTGKSGNTLTGCAGGTGTHDSGSPVSIASFIGVRVDNPALLPSSGTTTVAVTIAAGRPDTQVNYARFIGSTQPIRGYNGAVPSGVSPLADLAASMSSGDWQTITMTNMNTSSVDAGGGHSVIEFCARGHWDPVHKLIQFWGRGHNQGELLLTYDDLTNTWSHGTPPNGDPVEHAYYHLALDRSTGDLYLREYGSAIIRKKPYGGAWTTIASCHNTANQVAGGLEWMQSLNGGAGGLAFVDQLSLETYNPGSDTWTVQSSSLTSMGPYHNWIVSANGSIWAGGGNGSTRMYKMTAAGTVSAATDSPREAGIWAEPATARATPLGHPDGKKVLIFDTGATGAIDCWDGTSWTSLGTHQIGAGGWFGVPISDYGVILFVVQNVSSTGTVTCRVYKP